MKTKELQMIKELLPKELNRFKNYITKSQISFSFAVGLFKTLEEFGDHENLDQNELDELKKRIKKLEQICNYNIALIDLFERFEIRIRTKLIELE